MPWVLRVMVDDLKKVMFGVLKHHKYAFVFKDDFDQANNIGIV